MSTQALTERPASLFVNGAFRTASGGDRLSVVDPSTGQPFAEIACADAADVEAAVGAAAAAFPPWARLAAAERAVFLRRIAEGLRRRADALAQLQMLNNGKPRAEAEIDVGDAVATFDYYAGLAEGLDARQGEPVPMPDAGFAGKTRFEPVGPVGMIVPWNFPLVTSAWKIAPALAAGCTVVLKTSEFTPLVELAYGDIAQEAELPAGVLNLITGAAEAGAALTRDRRLRKLSFTGSNLVGSKVMAAAAARCLPVSLELGGKSPIVVFADADLDHAVDCIAGGIFFNAGQMCSATSRLIVEASIAPALLDRLAARAKALPVGSPFAQGSEMGPITTRPQFEKVLRFLDQARADRLEPLAGGEGGSDAGGFFVQPSVFADVPTASFLWREEIFGPVLAVRSFRTEAEAVEMANDSDYGLVATVVSGDPARAERVAARIDAGHVWINSLQVIYPNTAWGGFKASGIGRELGPWGLSAFLGVKHLTIASGGAVKVAVLGAGVVGVATAYYLARDGHEVVLIERRAKAAEEASFGNGGLVSPSDSYAWASPDALRMAVKSLYRSDLGIKYKLRLDPRLWIWSLRFLGQCTGAAARRNTLVKLRLISYAKDCLNEVVAETGVDYDGLSRGILYYFRSPEGLKAAGHHMGILRDQGLPLETVGRERMLELEPVMARAPDVAGGIYSPDCQTGDSHRFANNLAGWCAASKGATLLYDTPIRRLVVAGDRVVKAQTDHGDVAADAFVLAAGAESVFLAEPIGIRLPIYPVKGFSITAPLLRPEAGPRMGLVDEDRLVAMSPLGGRLRAASSAVFGGFDYGHRPEDFRTILETTRLLYGDAVDYAAAVHWTGLRPMTPSSVPILGPSRYRNLLLNVGHGHVGWSMCCGSGRFVADCLAGRPTEIDGTGLLAA